jgi:hypothetical protein
MNETIFTETTPTPKPATVRYKPRYICKSKVKQLALQTAKSQLSDIRQKMFTRVGTSFYEACDAFLANFIASRVRSHPSKGKTLT